MRPIDRIQLRTTDIDAARAFYVDLLGEDALEIVTLPERARALGAPAHWLGLITVDDLQGALRSFIAGGATLLGPISPDGDEGMLAVVRDPGNAVIGLTTASASPPSPRVTFQVLHASEADRTIAAYVDAFGWALGPRLDRGRFGIHQQFAWASGASMVGAAVDIAGRPELHPHWSFHFLVPSLDSAIERVRAAGGTVIGPMVLETGDRIAACEDPQRAAFVLHERAP